MHLKEYREKLPIKERSQTTAQIQQPQQLGWCMLVALMTAAALIAPLTVVIVLAHHLPLVINL